MTKIQEWEKMIDKVNNDTASKIEILRFLETNKPKPKESKKKQPCICGSRDIKVWWHMTEHKFLCQCEKCERQAPGARTEIQAIRNWNEMMEKEREKDGSEN